MNKFIAYFSLLLISLFAAPSFAGDRELVEHVKVQGGDLFERYQVVANCFNGRSLNSGHSNTGTSIISYDVRETQIAFFKDGFIITFLSGENEGKQIVVYQDKIIGVSYPCEMNGWDLTHSYVWGRVNSCYQDVGFYIENIPLFQSLIEEGMY